MAASNEIIIFCILNVDSSKGTRRDLYGCQLQYMKFALTQLPADEELVAKLNSERSLELQETDADKPAAITEFLENSPFQLHDQPGTHEVVLTRDFGNEKLVPYLDDNNRKF